MQLNVTLQEILTSSVLIDTLFLSREDFITKIKKINRNILDDILFQKAHEIAERAYRGEKRDNGVDYLEGHIYPIIIEYIKLVDGLNKPENVEINILIDILLHDAWEDCPAEVNSTEIAQSFPLRVIEVLRSLTKRKWECYEGENKEEKNLKRDADYLNALLSSEYDEVCVIKSIDLIQNLSCSVKYFPESEKTARYFDKVKRFMPVFKKSGYKRKEVEKLWITV